MHRTTNSTKTGIDKMKDHCFICSSLNWSYTLSIDFDYSFCRIFDICKICYDRYFGIELQQLDLFNLICTHCQKEIDCRIDLKICLSIRENKKYRMVYHTDCFKQMTEGFIKFTNETVYTEQDGFINSLIKRIHHD